MRLGVCSFFLSRALETRRLFTSPAAYTWQMVTIACDRGVVPHPVQLIADEGEFH